MVSVYVNRTKSGGRDKVKEYQERATAGDCDNLLAVSMEYVDFDI